MAKLLSRIGTVSAFTMISRILGLARDMMTSAFLGTSVWNSAFITAFTLPNLFRRLLGEGALTAALMPNLSEELEERGREAVHELVNKTLSWLIVICLAICVLVIGAMELVPLLPVSEKWNVAASLAQIVFPYVLLICVAAILSAALNLFSRFGIPALTAVWLNSSIIIALGVSGWLLGSDLESKTYWLCGGAMFGGVLQMLIPGFALMKEGWRPRLDLGVSSRLREVALLTVPGIFGAAVFQVNIMVSRGLAFSVSDAAASLLYYANRLVELPVGVFAIAISTVIFPSLSAAIAGKKRGQFAAIYRKGISLCLLMAVPSAVGLSVLAPEIVELLFERGRFATEDTLATVPLVYVFAIGMPFYSFISIETRAFFALKDTRTPVKSAAIAFAVNVVLSLALMGKYGAVGLAIATNFAAIVQMILLHLALRKKKLDTSLKPLILQFVRIFFAALMMGVVVDSVSEWAGQFAGSGLVGLLALVVVSIAFGAGVYFVLLKVLGLKVREFLN